VLTKGSEITAIDLWARMSLTFWTASYPCCYRLFVLLQVQRKRRNNSHINNKTDSALWF